MHKFGTITAEEASRNLRSNDVFSLNVSLATIHSNLNSLQRREHNSRKFLE